MLVSFSFNLSHHTQFALSVAFTTCMYYIIIHCLYYFFILILSITWQRHRNWLNCIKISLETSMLFACINVGYMNPLATLFEHADLCVSFITYVSNKSIYVPFSTWIHHAFLHHWYHNSIVSNLNASSVYKPFLQYLSDLTHTQHIPSGIPV